MPRDGADVLVDQQDRLAGRAQFCETAPDLVADQRRQAFGRFVEDQQARICHQRAADRQHLLLAAGKQIRHAARAFGEPRKQRPDPFERPWFGGAAAIGRGGDEIFARREIGKNLAPFRHQADAELGHAVSRQRTNFGAVETDRAGRRRSQPHDRAHRRGLAHAVAAHQRHHFARRRPRAKRRTAPGLSHSSSRRRGLRAAARQPCQLPAAPRPARRDRPRARRHRRGSPPARRRRRCGHTPER